MIVDTSAFVTISFEEDGYLDYLNVLRSTNLVLVPTSVILEATMVLKSRMDLMAVNEFTRFVDNLGATIISFTPRMATLAQDAFLKYGKGQGHPAQLNFGDCMVYAAAKAEGAPLLYVGDDFAYTDIESAVG